MKSSRSAKVKPVVSEECGIWLDTKELREKKQKQLTRPISRLLNPLVRSGYSVAVALDFTQTKLKMPVTRQSTISTFFNPKPRDTQTGVKRKHVSLDASLESPDRTSDMKQQDCDGGFEQKEQHFLHLICGDEPEEEEPPEKRRHVVRHTHQNALETQEHSTKSHNHQQVRSGGQKVTGQRSVLTSINENLKPRAFDLTNTSQEQKCHKTKASPMKRRGKENVWPSSPIKTASPLKTKYASSPVRFRLKEKHGKDFEDLFTQDSEGFCVIAHREQIFRSLEKERRDGHHGDGGASGDDESDPEMLFTQDSEGNTVIRH